MKNGSLSLTFDLYWNISENFFFIHKSKNNTVKNISRITPYHSKLFKPLYKIIIRKFPGSFHKIKQRKKQQKMTVSVS